MRLSRFAPATRLQRHRSMPGCRPTTPAAILSSVSGLSWPIQAWPTGSPAGTETAAGALPEDLRQTTRAGLIAAVDRYDPGFGNPFVPYAVACVVGELKRYLRDTSWRLHVPRPLKEQALRLSRAADELHQRAWAAGPPPPSWLNSWSWARRRSWRRWRQCPADGRCR